MYGDPPDFAPQALDIRQRNWIKRLLPQTMFGRSLLLIVMPLVLVQIIAVWVFYARHWETVSRRLSGDVAGDIGMLIEAMRFTDNELEAGVRRRIRGFIEELLEEELTAALGRARLVARGPKPVAALRELGLTPTLAIPEPNTWREVLAGLDAHLPVAGQRVAVQEYGVANPELLAGLAARAGEAVSREDLSQSAPLRGNIRNVDVQMTRLRRKIEPDPRYPRYLQTVRGTGYALKPE